MVEVEGKLALTWSCILPKHRNAAQLKSLIVPPEVRVPWQPLAYISRTRPLLPGVCRLNIMSGHES